MIRAWFFLALMIGLSGCSPDSTEDRVHRVLADLREQYAFPGATLAWAGPDATVRTLAVGMADPGSGTPMAPDSRMPAASIGKSFVAAAVLYARERGLLDLDAPVSTWLGDRPWFSRLPNHQHLTLRHLLTHTSGLPDHVYLPEFRALFQATRSQPESPGPETLIELILDADPLFDAGEGWAYSDTGYLVAARALEAVTKRPWTESVESWFLDPLALEATTPSNRRQFPGLVTGITTAGNPFGLPERTTDDKGRLAWDPAIEDAGGGFISTSGDLARWGRNLWSGERLSRDSFRAMMTGAPVDPDRPGVTYGLGVVIEQGGPYGETRGHRGWVPGYVSSLHYYPDYDIAIALQINSDVGMTGEKGNLIPIESAVTRAILAGERKNR